MEERKWGHRKQKGKEWELWRGIGQGILSLLWRVGGGVIPHYHRGWIIHKTGWRGKCVSNGRCKVEVDEMEKGRGRVEVLGVVKMEWWVEIIWVNCN